MHQLLMNRLLTLGVGAQRPPLRLLISCLLCQPSLLQSVRECSETDS